MSPQRSKQRIFDYRDAPTFDRATDLFRVLDSASGVENPTLLTNWRCNPVLLETPFEASFTAVQS